MALLNGFKETETEQQYRRGEIYYINNASKEHVGSEMKKDRPAVIVSCDANNKHSDVLEVVFLTSAPKKDLPTHVTIRSTGRKSEALCEQPTPVSVERINNFVGKASEKEMEQIDIALLTRTRNRKMAAIRNPKSWAGGPHGNLNSRFRAV